MHGSGVYAVIVYEMKSDSSHIISVLQRPSSKVICPGGVDILRDGSRGCGVCAGTMYPSQLVHMNGSLPKP